MGVFSSWVNAPGNLRPAGISKVKVAGSDAPNVYFHLGITEGGATNLPALFQSDTFLRTPPFGHDVIVKFNSLQASLTEIELLDDLIAYQPLKVAAVFVDYATGNKMCIVSNDLGISWRLVSDGTFNKFRFIEYTFQGAIAANQLTALFADEPADGTPGGSEKLNGFGQVEAPSRRKPNGFSKIEIRVKGETSYSDLGTFRDEKFEFSTLTETFEKKRPRTHGIKGTIDAVLGQTTATERDLIEAINTNICEFKITLLDGVILTLSDSNNVRFTAHAGWDASGHVDKTRGIPLHIEGTILDFATPPTVWNGLWS
jgi:hypothetical protein